MAERIPMTEKSKQQGAIEWLERHAIMPHEIKTVVYAALSSPVIDREALLYDILEKALDEDEEDTDDIVRKTIDHIFNAYELREKR